MGQCRFPVREAVMSESEAVPIRGRRLIAAFKTRMSSFPLKSCSRAEITESVVEGEVMSAAMPLSLGAEGLGA